MSPSLLVCNWHRHTILHDRFQARSDTRQHTQYEYTYWKSRTHSSFTTNVVRFHGYRYLTCLISVVDVFNSSTLAPCLPGSVLNLSAKNLKQMLHTAFISIFAFDNAALSSTILRCLSSRTFYSSNAFAMTLFPFVEKTYFTEILNKSKTYMHNSPMWMDSWLTNCKVQLTTKAQF